MQTILEILRTDEGGIEIFSPFFDVISLDAPIAGPARRITAQMSANPELFEKLRAWRKVKAEEIDRPPFVIFHNKVLLELADIAPATEEALGAIKGIGPAKLERYGADILAITREFTSSPE